MCVFAVTQLSHHLLSDLSLQGALQTGLLLAMVWLVWVFTTWVTDWLTPSGSRCACHLVHPVMVAGIITTAAADELVLGQPGSTVEAPTAGPILGGTAFLGGTRRS